MARMVLLGVVLLALGCAGGPQAPDWQLNASSAMQAYQQRYLAGDTAAADAEFLEVRRNLTRTGRPDLLAQAELARCATRAAALEFDECTAFEKLRADASADALAYADYLAGRGSRAPTEDPLSRLVFFATQLRSGKIAPAAIGQAVDIASAQGWRRPLLAWLGVQLKRAEAAGDGEAAARLRRRIDLTAGQ